MGGVRAGKRCSKITKLDAFLGFFAASCTNMQMADGRLRLGGGGMLPGKSIGDHF